jgi:hypothetical protein
MYLDTLSYQFHGFHPSDFTRDYLTSLLEEIQEEAPYGATLKAHFARQGREFKATIEIHSKAGRFFARATGNRVKEVGHKTLEQIRRQMDKWRSSRIYEFNESA